MPSPLPGPGNPHGVYVFDRKDSRWKLLRDKGELFKLGELGEGIYLVYFDNLLCPACRSQDVHWQKIVEKYKDSSEFHFVLILCDWFYDNCSSEAASKSFKEYGVSASPTILVARVSKDGKVEEYLEGVRPDNVIEYYIKKVQGG